MIEIQVKLKLRSHSVCEFKRKWQGEPKGNGTRFPTPNMIVNYREKIMHFFFLHFRNFSCRLIRWMESDGPKGNGAHYFRNSTDSLAKRNNRANEDVDWKFLSFFLGGNWKLINSWKLFNRVLVEPLLLNMEQGTLSHLLICNLSV